MTVGEDIFYSAPTVLQITTQMQQHRVVRSVGRAIEKRFRT